MKAKGMAYSPKGVADPRTDTKIKNNSLGFSVSKDRRESHVQNTKYGMGDHYGTGERAKIGKLRASTVGFESLTPSKIKEPPKSLA